MKRLLSIIFILLISSSSLSFAQAGSVGVFTEPRGYDCEFSNMGGFLQVLCVHVNSPGAKGCQFALKISGTPLTYLGETSPFSSKTGNAQTGVNINYDTCMISPIHVLTVNYAGISSSCDEIWVVGASTAIPPAAFVLDCAEPEPKLTYFYFEWGSINNNGTCWCYVPTEETTWGQVKALYR